MNYQLRIHKKGIFKIITVIQERVAGGYKLAQDFEKNIYTFERGKWYDSYGDSWQTVEKVVNESN